MILEFADCARSFAALEEERVQLVAELTVWTAARLDFRPQPGAWSAVEVLDHIVKSETGTVGDIRAGLLHPHTLGDEKRPGIAALNSALRSDRRFTIPPGAEMIYPDSGSTLPEVASHWEQTRIQLGVLLEGLGPRNARCGVFCHPFPGWMTVAEVVDHLSAHLYHHGIQLERLRASSANL